MAAVRVLVVGVGNMGLSHAKAYAKLDGFELVGLMSRTIQAKKDKLPAELQGVPLFQDFDEAMRATRPDAVSINTYPNTHADYAIRAMEAGAHVFMEKPIATNLADAQRVWRPPGGPTASWCWATSCGCTRPGPSSSRSAAPSASRSSCA
jgi:predicted dehydrogenase